MITTSMVMAVALAIASVLLMYEPDLDKEFVAFGSIACIGVYLTAFSTGAGAIPWFLPGELLPTEVSIHYTVTVLHKQRFHGSTLLCSSAA